MTSRTPIRLTPHRGPLATPSTSPESSPTLSTPPTEFSDFSTASRPTLDIVVLERQISTLNPSMQHQYGSRPYRRRREVTKRGLFGCSTQLSSLSLVFENLLYSASELAETLTRIVTFCLCIWGLLEWSSYASGLPRQPSTWVSRFPLPSTTRALRCHANTSPCQLSDQYVPVLQFLSEHIQHAKALSSLSVSLGLPLRAFLVTHRVTIPRVIVRHDSSEPPHLAQEVDALANLTEFLDPHLLDFTSGGFIGRSFTLALEELGDLITKPMVSHGSPIHDSHQDIRLRAIHWRTASNLLLEYSAARPRVRQLSQHLYALHQQLSPLLLGYHVDGSVEERLYVWWWKSTVRHPVTSIEDEIQAFVTGLEVTLDNVQRLLAYLDWITEQLAQTTLKDVLKTQHRTDFSSCVSLLQELFVQSKPSLSKKHCFCLNDYRVVPSIQPERVEITVPGSPTVRAER